MEACSCGEMKFFSFLAITIVLCIGNVTSSGTVEYVEKMLDSPLEDIQWVTKKVLFLLTETGVLYRSQDGGRNWRTDSARFMAATEVLSIDISSVDPHYIFFRTKDASWYTTDMGKTYKRQTTIFSDIRLHLSEKGWLLGSRNSKGCANDDNSDCFKTLYYSKDFGESWSHCLDYVVQFDWAAKHHGEPDLVYATVHEHKVGSQKFGYWDKSIHFVCTSDYFKTQTVLVEHGNRFLFGTSPEGTHDLQMFIAAVNPMDETQVKLMIAKSEGAHTKFHEAKLPVELTEHSYTILETSEGTVFLHVNHKPLSEASETGHLYISDWSGLEYTLSLPYNRRNKAGKCDFEKIEGLEGIYIANFIDLEDQYVDEEQDTMGGPGMNRIAGGIHSDKMPNPRMQKKTKTVISFDKGGEWSYLASPTRDSNDVAIKCKKKCHLHLHGITGAHGPFYSSKYALGIIMATGTIGEFLNEADQQAVNTYLSRDAGLTWTEVAKGSHIYEYGDHGGLIVMADDTRPTDSIKYSWNEGLAWVTLQITDNPIYIDNIIIEPSSTAVEFVVYGWKGGSSGKGVAIHVDFSPLHEKYCQGADAPDTSASDYELWTPSDGRLGGKCMMGHTVHYVRRKPDHACFNPVEFERPKGFQHCACTREDFECDYGYQIEDIADDVTTDEKCIVMKQGPRHDDITKDIEMKDCTGGATRYTITQGYRRVPGDTCEGGTNWDPVVLPCNLPSSTASHVGKIILVILVLIAVTLAIVTCANKFDLFDKFHWKEKFASSFKYRAVGEDHEDAYYFNEPEFNQSAHLIHEDDDEHELDEVDDESGTFRPLPKAGNKQGQFIPTLLPPPGKH